MWSEWTYDEKKSYLFNVPKYNDYCHSLREQSFAMMGPKFFNSLPVYLRPKFKKFEHWKKELDNFLSQIPDNPVTSRELNQVYVTYIPQNQRIHYADGYHS